MPWPATYTKARSAGLSAQAALNAVNSSLTLSRMAGAAWPPIRASTSACSCSPSTGDSRSRTSFNGASGQRYSVSNQAATSEADRAALLRLAIPSCSPVGVIWGPSRNG
jgi:hypothetical protein